MLIPAIAFALIAAWGYRSARDDAESTVLHASALSLRQAERIFEISRKIALIADTATAGSDDDIRAREAEVHQRLTDLCAGLSFVVNLNVWSADGTALARSDVYPVDRRMSVADRAYFIEQQAPGFGIGISDVLIARQSGKEVVNVTIRRQMHDGRFNGVIAVSLSPDFLRDYYRSLASDEPNLASFAMVRTDGTIIARWPKLADGRTKVDPDNPVVRKIADGETEGVVVVAERADRESRVIAFRRVGGLPIYVTSGVSRSAMVAGWLRFVAILASILVPVTLGLVYVSWVALRKTRNEQATAIAMRQEVQRRAQAERALLEGQKLEALSQLTGGVAHDFNNLLAIVSNNLHMMRRKHPELSEERHVGAISRAVQSGVRLTRQLLSFSRKQALTPETVRLQDWLPATEDLIRSTLGRRAELEFGVDADTHPITVDLAELELALINTALNAHHAMPNGGRLRMTAANASDARSGERSMVVIKVEDSGTGIPSDIRDKVFEPFFSTKGVGKGSGLGLSQVAGLCEQAGGFAAIDSEAGRGTTVCMYFPAAELAKPAAPPVDRPATHRLDGRVLLVEDNDEVALASEQVLRTAGLDVIRVASADAALVTMGAGDIDVVLSDISMPGSMDGIELALSMRGRWPHMPVLLMTGYADRIDAAVAAGLKVLAKPVDPDAIVHEIAESLRRSRTVVPA